jgi:hypothetical protein
MVEPEDYQPNFAGGSIHGVFVQLSETRPYEKPILMWMITLRYVSWALIAAVTASFALNRPEFVLFLLVAFFVSFSMGGGLGAIVCGRLRHSYTYGETRAVHRHRCHVVTDERHTGCGCNRYGWGGYCGVGRPRSPQRP